MAAPTIDPILTNVTLANDLTDWDGFNDGTGGAGSDILEQDIFIQGIAAVSKKISGSTRDEGLYYQTATTVDISADANAHVYVWVAFTTQGFLESIANGGVYIRLEDSGGNWSKWYVDGLDQIDPTSLFKRYVIDTRKVESENSGTAVDLTDIEYWGVGVKTTTGTSKSENLIVDRIDYGTGLRIEDGDTVGSECDWQALFDDDTLVANKYGIVQKRGSIFYLLGHITVGDDAGTKNTTWLDTSGAVVEFENPQYYTGGKLWPAVGVDLYGIAFEGNATGDTNVDFGQVIGTGDDRQGIGGGIIRTAGPEFTIDGETDIAHLDSVNLYGLTVIQGKVKLAGDTETDIIGSTFVQCPQIEPNDAEWLNNRVIDSWGRGLEMLSTHEIKQTAFIAGEDTGFKAERVYNIDASNLPTLLDVTAEFNGETPGGANLLPAVGTQVIGDQASFGSKRPYGAIVFAFNPAGVGGVVDWEYYDGATWSALTGVTDGTSNLTTNGTVTFDIPDDWTPVSVPVAGDNLLYYIRAIITTVYTTTPVIDNTNLNQFDEAIEWAVHIPVAGTYGFDALEFFGYSPDGAPKWHAENSSAGLVTIDATNGANPSAAEVDLTGGGSVVVNNPQPIEITGVTEGARVSIVRLDTKEELLNALAFTDDGAGAFKGAAQFNYAAADVDVRTSAASSGKVVAGLAVDSGVNTDETVQANDSRTGAGDTMTLLPTTSPAAGDGFLFGHTEEFLQMDLDVLTAGIGTYTLDWEYWDGDSWEPLPGLSDGTNNFKNSGINLVSWTDPGDWATKSETNQPGPSALYYIRAIKAGAGTVTTTPVGRTTRLDVTRYRRWEDENTIVSSGLSAKATWVVDDAATFD